MRECRLEAGQPCSECGSCECCDLDPEKICDNCCRCLDTADYQAVKISEIILDPLPRARPKRGPH